MLYNFVRTSCSATEVTVSLMRCVLIKRGFGAKVADEGRTTSLVVRDFTRFPRAIAEVSSLLRCYAESLVRLLPEIRNIVAPFSSGSGSGY